MKIDRNPKTPLLNSRAIQLLTELCFRQNDPVPKKVDGIFVFGSTISIKKLCQLIEDLLTKKITQKVFLTGGVPVSSTEFGSFKTESDLVLNLINRQKFPDIQFFLERKSTNTLENVLETLKNPEFTECQSLIFIFKSHDAGRGFLTLKRYLPETKLYQQSFNPHYLNSEKEITRVNWSTFEFGRSRVWGEFLRIKTYVKKGDIEYDSVKDLVMEILYLTKFTR